MQLPPNPQLSTKPYTPPLSNDRCAHHEGGGKLRVLAHNVCVLLWANRLHFFCSLETHPACQLAIGCKPLQAHWFVPVLRFGVVVCAPGLPPDERLKLGMLPLRDL